MGRFNLGLGLNGLGSNILLSLRQCHLSKLESILSKFPTPTYPRFVKVGFFKDIMFTRKALYNLRNDISIIIKEVDKGSLVVVWDKQDNQKEAEEEPSSKEMYEEVADHPSHLIDVMHKALKKIPKRGDIDINTLKYFDVK